MLLIKSLNKLTDKINIIDNFSELDIAINSLGNYDSTFILTQNEIFNLYLDEAIFNEDHKHIFVENGEEAKNLINVEKIIKYLVENQCTRNSLLIGFGGGVITDLTGFIASIYMRGIDYILIPTTLLSMVDASIGGKTGINFSNIKNLIGTFNEPKRIYIQPTLLFTLNKKEILNGFAEIIKYGLICDKDLFAYIETNLHTLIKDGCISPNNINQIKEIVIKCINYKTDIVSKDLFDYNHRMILNFGHTIGHAIESYYDYIKISHGDAVYHGMIGATYISHKLEYISENEFEIIYNFINSIPKVDIKDIDYKQLLKLIKYDKKNLKGNNNFILLKSIGEAIIVDQVDENLIEETIKFIIN